MDITAVLECAASTTTESLVNSYFIDNLDEMDNHSDQINDIYIDLPMYVGKDLLEWIDRYVSMREWCLENFGPQAKYNNIANDHPWSIIQFPKLKMVRFSFYRRSQLVEFQLAWQ